MLKKDFKDALREVGLGRFGLGGAASGAGCAGVFASIDDVANQGL